MTVENTEPASAPESADVSRDQLAGLFADEMAAEDKEPAATPETENTTPGDEPQGEVPPNLEARLEEQNLVQSDPEGAQDPQSDPNQDPATAIINAPSGMSEADQATFEQLPPEVKSWVSKRETDRQSDYTRKTAEVAHGRRQIADQARHLQHQIQQYDQILAGFTDPILTPPNPELRYSDPETYDAEMSSYVHQKHQQEMALNERAENAAQNERQQAAEFGAFVSRESQELAQLAPELTGSDSKSAALRKGVADYGMANGYTAAQLSQVSARDSVILMKAYKYDAALKAKASATRVQPAAPQVSAPGASKAVSGRNGSIARAVENLDKNPTRDALASAYEAELAMENN